MDKKKILQLRKATMLGIAKCRQALLQAQGDFDKAIEILRKEGQKVANKRAGMEMHQGRIFAGIHPKQSFGIIIGISSETDFAANSDQFRQVGQQLLQQALTDKITDLEKFLTTPFQSHTVQEALIQLSGQVKENISIKHYQVIQGDFIGYYVHTGSKLGAMVSLSNAHLPHQKMAAIAKDVAMQVVISDPIAIDKAGIPSDLFAKERDIITTQLQQQNKPPQIIEKITQQKLQKFIDENTLLPQPFIKDETQTIQNLLQQASPDLTITTFSRVQIA